MLYVDAIRILEKIAQARFLHATMPKQEEIEEAIKVVASQCNTESENGKYRKRWGMPCGGTCRALDRPKIDPDGM